MKKRKGAKRKAQKGDAKKVKGSRADGQRGKTKKVDGRRKVSPFKMKPKWLEGIAYPSAVAGHKPAPKEEPPQKKLRGWARSQGERMLLRQKVSEKLPFRFKYILPPSVQSKWESMSSMGKEQPKEPGRVFRNWPLKPVKKCLDGVLAYKQNQLLCISFEFPVPRDNAPFGEDALPRPFLTHVRLEKARSTKKLARIGVDYDFSSQLQFREPPSNYEVARMRLHGLLNWYDWEGNYHRNRKRSLVIQDIWDGKALQQRGTLWFSDFPYNPETAQPSLAFEQVQYACIDINAQIGALPKAQSRDEEVEGQRRRGGLFSYPSNVIRLIFFEGDVRVQGGNVTSESVWV